MFIAALAIQYFWQTQSANNSTVVELSPPTLPASFTDLEYSEIELAFAGLHFESEQLVLNATTESQFSIALEQLPDNFEASYFDRISFLIRKQFGDKQGPQILSFLKNMAAYKKQEAVWWERESNTQSSMAQAVDEPLKSSADKFTSLFDLQDQYFGKEAAQKLYGEQRRLMRYMTATLAIEKNESLSEQQKQDALDALARSLESPQQ